MNDVEFGSLMCKKIVIRTEVNIFIFVFYFCAMSCFEDIVDDRNKMNSLVTVVLSSLLNGT
jgi:hypothetical protein